MPALGGRGAQKGENMLPDIYVVADILGLTRVKKNGIGSRYYICPFCDDTTGHLNIVGGDSRVWRCARCGKGGGVINLVENCLDISAPEAKRFLRQDEKLKEAINTTIVYKNAPKKATDVIDEDAVHKVYSALLASLTLTDEHRQKLHDRGFSDKAIAQREYKTAPSKEENLQICERLQEQGYTLEGIPGFYLNQRGDWQLNVYAEGFLIPFRDVMGRITMLQTRLDNPPSGSQKYITLSSSNMKKGARSISTAHYVGVTPPDVPIKKVILTEGALKADAAVYLRHVLQKETVPFLAIPGVNNTKALRSALVVLQKRGLTDVYDGFDMDKSDRGEVKLNENVKKAVEKIRDLCREMGFAVHTLEWHHGKGIDDYNFFLVNKKR